MAITNGFGPKLYPWKASSRYGKVHSRSISSKMLSIMTICIFFCFFGHWDVFFILRSGGGDNNNNNNQRSGGQRVLEERSSSIAALSLRGWS